MKYLLYRSLGELEDDEEQHQLVGVEVGKDVYSVADTFVKIVNYDMSCEFPGCQGTVCYAPEFEQFAQRYDYHMFAYAHFSDDTMNCKKMKGNTSGHTGMVSNGYKKS